MLTSPSNEDRPLSANSYLAGSRVKSPQSPTQSKVRHSSDGSVTSSASGRVPSDRARSPPTSRYSASARPPSDAADVWVRQDAISPTGGATGKPSAGLYVQPLSKNKVTLPMGSDTSSPGRSEGRVSTRATQAEGPVTNEHSQVTYL